MGSFERTKQIRHFRVLNVREKLVSGWNEKDLLDFCEIKLGVSRVTAVSYIDEAAEPYRKKYEGEEKKNEK